MLVYNYYTLETVAYLNVATDHGLQNCINMFNSNLDLAR